MLFNNRTNNSSNDSNTRSQSIGNKIFSYTGVRFFQPKFMDTLNNKPSVMQKTSSKASTLSIKPESKVGKLPRVEPQKIQKQNIMPLQPLSQSRKKQHKIAKRLPEPIYKICVMRGLQNIGNTCYMNSTLQCLLNLSKFNSQFQKEVRIKNGNSSGLFDVFSSSKKVDVALEYANLVSQFYDKSDNSAYTPSKLKNSVGKKKSRFAGTSQQDAQQFLTAFLELSNQEMSRITQKPKYVELDNDPNKKSVQQLSQQSWQYYKKRDDSVICDNFQGQLVSTVTCKKCKNQSVTFDNIWGLPLSIQKTTSSINQLIKKHWNVQSQISDYYCSKCSQHRTCLKKLQLFKLPQILVIQLKRFQYGKYRKQKIKTSVKLSETLNLSETISEHSSDKNSLYKLTSMVHHYGEVDFGHYTASCLKDNTKKWYLLNDSKVSENIPDSPSSTVYLLFYQKVSSQ